MQIILNGLVNGLLLSCLALGFSIVYLPTRIFFVTLGAIYALAPYIAKSVLDSGGPWWLSVVVATSIAVIISALCEFYAARAKLSLVTGEALGGKGLGRKPDEARVQKVYDSLKRTQQILYEIIHGGDAFAMDYEEK